VAIDRHRDKWRARWRDETGAQRAKSFDTKKAAADHLAAMQTAVNSGAKTSFDRTIRIADLADDWLSACVHLAPGTIWTYRRDCTRYILPSLGDIKAADLAPATIARWINEELVTFAPSSVKRHHRTLATMLNWAVEQGIIQTNPANKVKAPRTPRKEMEIFTVEQIETVANAVPEQFKAFILVAAYGGLRWSEIVGLRRMDVNGDTITVAGQLLQLDGQWMREEPKTNAGRRSVKLPQSVAEDLQTHMDAFTAAGPRSLIFTNREGGPVAQSFRRNHFYPACLEAGMGKRTIVNNRPGWSGMPRFHDLRHTSVALAIASGAHPKEIQMRLGHASIAITMDRYGHLMAGMDSELAASMDKMRAGK